MYKEHENAYDCAIVPGKLEKRVGFFQKQCHSCSWAGSGMASQSDSSEWG